MKTKDIAKTYGVNQLNFEWFLRNNNLHYKQGVVSVDVDDSDVQAYVAKYKEFQAEKESAEQAAKLEAEKMEAERKQAEEEKNQAMSKMLITSGFNFDGYTITKYSGYISGDDCITMPRNNFWGTNDVSKNLCDALVKIRRQAIKELKEAAYNLGCNAVVGVDFDYMTLDPQHAGALNATVTIYEPYVVCVTANGNADCYS